MMGEDMMMRLFQWFLLIGSIIGVCMGITPGN